MTVNLDEFVVLSVVILGMFTLRELKQHQLELCGVWEIRGPREYTPGGPHRAGRASSM